MLNTNEIKFKALRRDGGNEWLTGYYANINGEDFIIEPDGVKTSIYVNTLCMTTGRTDSKGKEIFTGDILKYKFGCLGPHSELEPIVGIVEVVYEGGIIYCTNVDDDIITDFLRDPHYTDIEVIGHIGNSDVDLAMDEYYHCLEQDSRDALDINRTLEIIKNGSRQYLNSK
jgi:hypothetical protein